MKTELWRQVLCWGSVITFLVAPWLVFILHIISDQTPEFHFSAHLNEYKFMTPFFQSVTALIFGLAGLNSLDRFTALKNEGRANQQQLINQRE